MDFEFNNQLVPQSLISIEDVGQMAIEGVNDDGFFYYLTIHTVAGKSTICQCGPVVPDINELPDGYSCSLTKMTYKQEKIEMFINKWLNDRSKLLTSAKQIEFQDAVSQFRDLGQYLQNYIEGLL